MNCSMPGSSVFHHLQEIAQIHVHWVGDAVWPSHPLLPSSPFAFNLSQPWGLFYWVSPFASGGQSTEASASATVLLMNYSGLTSFRIDWFGLLAVQETLKSLSPAPQFKSINSSAISLLYGPTFTFIHGFWKNHSFDYTGLCCQNNVSAFSKALSSFVIALMDFNIKKQQQQQQQKKPKTKITASSPITSWQIERGKVEAVNEVPTAVKITGTESRAVVTRNWGGIRFLWVHSFSFLRWNKSFRFVAQWCEYP